MAAVVKQEPVDSNQNAIESKVWSVIQSKTDGVLIEELCKLFPGFEPPAILGLLNNISKKYPINYFKKSDGELVVKSVAKPSANELKGANNEEKLVYQLIEKAGTIGIAKKPLQLQSNIDARPLDKILKSLEGKKLIKPINSINSSRLKIYILYDVEPDDSVTGGTFYSNQKFDSVFVTAIRDECLKLLTNKSEASKGSHAEPLQLRDSQFLSSAEILALITKSNIFKVKLTLNNIESIMETLIYDGIVEKNVVTESNNQPKNLYKTAQPLILSTGLVRMPCGHCPVQSECRTGGVISPENCEYMAAWLDIESCV